MDLHEAFGGKCSFPEEKRRNKDRTRPRIKNLEPKPEPATENKSTPAPQSTNLRPSDVNPTPSSVPRGPVSSFSTLGKALGYAARSTLGSIGGLGSANDPGIYLIQIQESRDDCHLICIFLRVFILSFLLTNRKAA